MSRMLLIGVLASLGSMAGCGGESVEQPPTVRLGDTVCDYCNMIVSDERWATSTIVHGDRGPEARLFDDFNCQVNYEMEHAGLEIVTRWSHDHATHEWLKTSQAYFLLAPSLRTPMGSQIAAFASESALDTAKSKSPGDVMTFEQAWSHLGYEPVPASMQKPSAPAASDVEHRVP